MKYCKWGDIVTLEYGKSLRTYSDSGTYRVYGTNGPIGWNDRALVKGPGVIIGRKGAYRGVHYSPAPFYVIDTAFYVKPKIDMDVRWMYYALVGQDINGLDSGSAIPSTTRDAFYNLDAVVPSLAEQKKIGGILGMLDDKIESNREVSRTLEAVGRALFWSWFVHFDPVRARAAQLEGPQQNISNLFPDSLKDSVLGKIPDGWRVGFTSEVSDVVYGAAFSSSHFNSDSHGIPLLRIRDLPEEKPKIWTEEVHPRGHLIQLGDIVVGMDGQFRAHVWGGSPVWLNQRVCAFIPKSNFSRAFVYYSLMAPLAEIERTETATTVIHLGKSDIDNFTFVLPPNKVLAAFDTLAQPVLQRIANLKQQSYQLEKVRNLILPKMIGQGLALQSGTYA